ncbi:hypothetical protein N8568_02235, partial [bacterium]|nr:hypothetical protein [bacterium]
FKRIPNCHYLNTSIDTYELLENCQFVASITGTACWESVSGGKPALIFGNVWFKKLPGVISWRPDLSLAEITDTPIDHEDLERAYSDTMSKTSLGLVDIAYKTIYPEYTEKENGKLITSFLRKAMKLD